MLGTGSQKAGQFLAGAVQQAYVNTHRNCIRPWQPLLLSLEESLTNLSHFHRLMKGYPPKGCCDAYDLLRCGW